MPLFQVTELYSERKSDGVKVRITVTLTNELPPNSPQFIHVFNIIFHRFVKASSNLLL